MTTREINLNLDGLDSAGLVVLWAWQANPLTIIGTCGGMLAAGLPAETTRVVAEIHTTQTPAGTDPLASKTVDAVADATEYQWDFSTTEMSFSIGSSAVSAIRYLSVTARNDDGDILLTLTTRRIEIKATQYSGLNPDPPTPAVYLSVAAAGETYYSKTEVDDLLAAASANSRYLTATLTAGQSTVDVTLLTGEKIANVVPDGVTTGLSYQGCTIASLTHTLQFSGTQATDLPLLLTIKK